MPWDQGQRGRDATGGAPSARPPSREEAAGICFLGYAPHPASRGTSAAVAVKSAAARGAARGDPRHPAARWKLPPLRWVCRFPGWGWSSGADTEANLAWALSASYSVLGPGCSQEEDAVFDSTCWLITLQRHRFKDASSRKRSAAENVLCVVVGATPGRIISLFGPPFTL